MVITTGWLERHHFTADEVARFEKEWPDGVMLSLEFLSRAAELGFDVKDFAEILLGMGKLAQFTAEQAEAERAMGRRLAFALWNLID